MRRLNADRSGCRRLRSAIAARRSSNSGARAGKGQFSVAGNTVIFVAGPLQDRACSPERAQADDDLVAALSEAATWKRQGDTVSFIGTKALRFRVNTN